METKKTITISLSLWKKLSSLKVQENRRSFTEVIEILLIKKGGTKKCKK